MTAEHEKIQSALREQHIAAGKCREPVAVAIAWTRYCDNKASTDAGYCKIHDPECKRARNHKRSRR